LLSPIDIRELRVGQLVADDTGNVFIPDRAKSGRAADDTLTVWSEAILNHGHRGAAVHGSLPARADTCSSDPTLRILGPRRT